MKNLAFLSLLAVAMLFSTAAAAQPGDCNPQKIKVHLQPNTGEIKVTPNTLNQKRGCAVIIRVPRGQVTSILSSYEWLQGSSGGEDIYIDVPEGVENGDYKYDVEIEGVGILDPIIRVSN